MLWKYFSKIFSIKYTQLQTVDHSVRWSMKNAASCVKRCEMQDTPSTWFSNAYCGVGSFPAPRLSEGRYEIKHIIQVRNQSSRPIQSCLLVGLIHTSDRIRQLFRFSFYAMRVIVQNIGDNSRTLHVLLANRFCSMSLKRHVFVCLSIGERLFRFRPVWSTMYDR